MKYILFYSVNCRYSHKIQQILQRNPELNVEFQKYAIETLKPIPQGLREVPTIMEKESGQVYSGQQAFDWLQTKLKNNFVSGPNISSKHGIEANGFSFINSDDKEYSSMYSSIGGDSNNGANINPLDFDQKTGQPKGRSMPVGASMDIPKTMSESEFKKYNEVLNKQISMGNSVADSVYQEYQNIGQSAIGNKPLQGGGQVHELPKELQPIKISKEENGVNLDELAQKRNAELGTQPIRRM